MSTDKLACPRCQSMPRVETWRDDELPASCIVVRCSNATCPQRASGATVQEALKAWLESGKEGT